MKLAYFTSKWYNYNNKSLYSLHRRHTNIACEWKVTDYDE